MTDWKALSEPFPDHEIKQRQGPGGMTFSYVDARAVAQRLDDVLTPEGWDFQWTLEANPDWTQAVVHGKLIIGGNIREDAGYPNSDRDEEPIKAAVSDALKRCAVLFGVGRHLYEDNKAPRAVPARQAAPTRAPARPQVVRDEDEANPFDDPAPTATATVTCPYHGFELKDRGYGLSCSGKVDKGGPMNSRGYCDWHPAA